MPDRLPLDQVLAGDCLRVLPTLPEACASLAFTSPPYNAGMPYEAGDGQADGSLSWDEWTGWLRDVWCACARCLRPGGHLVVNVPQGVGRSGDWPYQPVASAIAMQLHQVPGLRVTGEVVWDKGATRQNSTAWGSWMSPSSPSVRDCHEMVIIARKPRIVDGKERGLEPSVPGAVPDIGRDEFLACTLSVWTGLGTVSQEGGDRWHPAAFPVALAQRVVRFLSFPGDVVLDPFAGSGTTGVAARALGRRFVGVELNPEWAARAQARIEAAALQSALPWGQEAVRG